MNKTYQYQSSKQNLPILIIHTLCVHYAHVAANLNSGITKYAKVVRVHYFCTIERRTPYTHVCVVYDAFTLAQD